MERTVVLWTPFFVVQVLRLVFISQMRLHVVLVYFFHGGNCIYTRLGHELSKEGGNVVEVVDDKEDGEADGETEDNGESNEELPKMI